MGKKKKTYEDKQKLTTAALKTLNEDANVKDAWAAKDPKDKAATSAASNKATADKLVESTKKTDEAEGIKEKAALTGFEAAKKANTAAKTKDENAKKAVIAAGKAYEDAKKATVPLKEANTKAIAAKDAATKKYKLEQAAYDKMVVDARTAYDAEANAKADTDPAIAKLKLAKETASKAE